MQRLRQLEPSWLRRGQTTSLLESVSEKEDVREDRGGILTVRCGSQSRASKPHHALGEGEAGVREIEWCCDKRSVGECNRYSRVQLCRGFAFELVPPAADRKS
jgi:hypothetical protein